MTPRFRQATGFTGRVGVFIKQHSKLDWVSESLAAGSFHSPGPCWGRSCHLQPGSLLRRYAAFAL